MTGMSFMTHCSQLSMKRKIATPVLAGILPVLLVPRDVGEDAQVFEVRERRQRRESTELPAVAVLVVQPPYREVTLREHFG